MTLKMQMKKVTRMCGRFKKGEHELKQFAMRLFARGLIEGNDKPDSKPAPTDADDKRAAELYVLGHQIGRRLHRKAHTVKPV